MVYDLNIRRSCFRPNEADSPLIVDSNAVLTLSIAFQRFKLIAWRRAKEVKSLSGMYLCQLALAAISACGLAFLSRYVSSLLPLCLRRWAPP